MGKHIHSSEKNIFFAFLLPVWLLSGKAHLKHEIARRVTINASVLPYRQDFLDYLRAEHASGRKLVLATASAETYAQAVASELGIFSAVHASTCTTNLSAHRKADALSEHYGARGFDYAGNDCDDIAVFNAARQAKLSWRRILRRPGSRRVMAVACSSAILSPGRPT